MLNIDVARIASWHAHVYFDAATRDAARAFREIVSAQFGDRVALGRFHERPVGPHPCWSFQIAVPPTQFAEVGGGGPLNHRELDVFVHPNTDDAMARHQPRARPARRRRLTTRRSPSFAERAKHFHFGGPGGEPLAVAPLAVRGKVRRLAMDVQRSLVRVGFVEQEEVGVGG